MIWVCVTDALLALHNLYRRVGTYMTGSLRGLGRRGTQILASWVLWMAQVHLSISKLLMRKSREIRQRSNVHTLFFLSTTEYSSSVKTRATDGAHQCATSSAPVDFHSRVLISHNQILWMSDRVFSTLRRTSFLRLVPPPPTYPSAVAVIGVAVVTVEA